MKNLIITSLHRKDVNHFTADVGLYLRRKLDKPFKKLCNIFTKVLTDTLLNSREYVQKEIDLQSRDIIFHMRKKFYANRK